MYSQQRRPEVLLWEVSYLRHRLPGHDTFGGRERFDAWFSGVVVNANKGQCPAARLAQLPLRIRCAKCLTLRHPKSCDSAAQKQKISGRLRSHYLKCRNNLAAE